MNFTDVDMKENAPKYWRVATKEEMKYLTREILEKLKKAKRYIDPNTFEPFTVIDGVRYNIELIVDRKLS